MTSQSRIQCCGNCLFIRERGGCMVCIRNPPTSSSEEKHGFFPRIAPGWICGEWRPFETEKFVMKMRDDP